MSSILNHKASRSGGGGSRHSQSLFFRDVTSPISSHRGNSVTPNQAAAISTPWKENFTRTDFPPPPIFTLEDRAVFSPASTLNDLPLLPLFARSDMRSPLTPKILGGNGGYSVVSEQKTPSTTGSWWSSQKSGGGEGDGGEEKAKGSPVDWVVESVSALVVLPPPVEVARPEVQRENVPMGRLDEEEWVTAYGFSPGATNLVLREFETCGVILKHFLGPRDTNWIHILYQNQYDAQKALAKNGLQINSVVIIGVKPVDGMQRQFLNEKLNKSNKGGFMVSFPPRATKRRRNTTDDTTLKPSSRPYHLQSTTDSITDNGRHLDGAIATPAKSVFSKTLDLMFGL